MQAQPRIWMLTGPPGIGKSTIVSRTVYLLRLRGRGVGGCVTKEKRSGKERVGFGIFDLMSGREGELASVHGSLGPRVGRYRVNIADLAKIGARALREAAETAEVIVIDEVGPMELTSPEFKSGVRACLDTGKPIVAVVHEQMKDPLVEEMETRQGRVLKEVTLQNREKLADELATSVMAFLAKSEGAC